MTGLNDERPPLGGRSEHARVADRMEPRRWHCGRQATEQRERVEVDGDGAVAERPLERDAHEPVGAGQKPLRGERRPKDVLEEGLATFLVVGPGSRGGVQAEAHFAYRKRRCDNDAGAAVEGDLHGAAAELGAGGREAGDGGSRELSESWIALGESVIDA